MSPPRLPILWYQGYSSQGVTLTARPHTVRKLKLFSATTPTIHIPSLHAQDQADESPSLIVAELKISTSLLPKSAIGRSPHASKSSPCSPPALGSFWLIYGLRGRWFQRRIYPSTFRIIPLSVHLDSLSVHLNLYIYHSIRNRTGCSNHKAPLNVTS
jgi:hypothetical protein